MILVENSAKSLEGRLIEWVKKWLKSISGAFNARRGNRICFI